MTEPKARMAKDGPFEVNDKLAGVVPMATEPEQVAMTADIDENQQREPIVLWRGKVVDGRCRQKALTLLGRHIIYKELDDSLTEEEVIVFVKSINMRRNLTSTQKVIIAMKESLKQGSKPTAIIAKSWGVSEVLVKNARYINIERPAFIEPLFNGLSVSIVNSNGIEVSSNKVSAIYAYLKRTAEDSKEVEEHGWESQTNFVNQRAKEWYYSFVKDNKVSDVTTRMAIARLANFEHKELEDSKEMYESIKNLNI